jgi:5-(carboxyamino)imidazole ribonucleotide mutase
LPEAPGFLPENSGKSASFVLTASSPRDSVIEISLMPTQSPPIAIIMGSQSDWPIMRAAATVLDELGVAYEALVISAHRTPDRLYAFCKSARTAGFKVIIAGAGGAAHLPGMTAALITLPVLGVPISTTPLNGEDALYSIVQMPAGVPVGTLAIGEPGALNAGLLAAKILGLSDPQLAARIEAWRADKTAKVATQPSNAP